MGKRNHDILPKELADAVDIIDDEILRTGEVYSREEVIQTDRDYDYFLATRGPFYNTEGEIEGIFGMSLKIYEFREYQGIINQQQRFKSLNTLVLGLSHDVNNFLLRIIGNAEVLRLTHQDDESQKITANIIRTAQIVSDLFSNLLEVGKSRPNSQKDLVVLDIKEEIDEVLQILGVVDYPDLNIITTIEGKQTSVKMQKEHLTQILVNIILNSIEAIEGVGDLSINVTTFTNNPTKFKFQKYSALPAGYYTKIKIEDDGPGIPEEIMCNIFSPYFSTKSTGNSGLGLYMCYSIIKEYDGEIFVTTKSSVGTTFEVILPVRF